MINYAHRGASSYYPENTLSAFWAGVEMGANGIETDVHETRDGVLVLFHDDMLDRVTDGKGPIWLQTYSELKKLRVFSEDRQRTDSILSLNDFLEAFSSEDIHFAVELKQSGIEQNVLRLLNDFKMRDKTTLTSFNFDSLRAARVCDPGYRIGYLYDESVTDAAQKMRALGGEELCPRASMIRSPKDTLALKREGFGVRVWGVKDEETMKRMCCAGVDGMTVNFPDKLAAFLRMGVNEV